MPRWAAHSLLAAALSVVATWPWATLVLDHVGQRGRDPDLHCGLWWPAQFADAVVHLRNPFFEPDFLWPHGQDTTLLLWNYGAQLLLFPIHLVAPVPLGTNVATFATLVVNALAAAWAGRAVSGSPWGALAGLVVGATDYFAFAEGLYGRPEQALWAPNAVYLGALALLAEEPGRRRWTVIAGVALAVAGGVYWFYAYFLVLVTVGLALARAARGRLGRRGLLDLAGVAAVSAVAVLPFIAPVALAMVEHADVYATVKTHTGNPFGQQLMASVPPERLVWPLAPAKDASRNVSVLTLPLLAWGLARGRGAVRETAGIGLAGLVFAMGPMIADGDGDALRVGSGVVYLPGILLDLLPGYTRFWWPYRWLGVVYPAVAILAAWGVARVARPRLALGLLAAVGVAQSAASLRSAEVFAEAWIVPPVIRAIGAMPYPAPVLQLPRDGVMNSAVGYQAIHRQPIDGGIATHILRGPNGTKTETPLLVQALTMPGRLRVPDGAWTKEGSGGFHYVLYYKRGNLPQGGDPTWTRVVEVLGQPFYDEEGLSAWVVPGMGAVPPMPGG